MLRRTVVGDTWCCPTCLRQMVFTSAAVSSSNLTSILFKVSVAVTLSVPLFTAMSLWSSESFPSLLNWLSVWIMLHFDLKWLRPLRLSHALPQALHLSLCFLCLYPKHLLLNFNFSLPLYEFWFTWGPCLPLGVLVSEFWVLVFVNVYRRTWEGCTFSELFDLSIWQFESSTNVSYFLEC